MSLGDICLIAGTGILLIAVILIGVAAHKMVGIHCDINFFCHIAFVMAWYFIGITISCHLFLGGSK